MTGSHIYVGEKKLFEAYFANSTLPNDPNTVTFPMYITNREYYLYSFDNTIILSPVPTMQPAFSQNREVKMERLCFDPKPLSQIPYEINVSMTISEEDIPVTNTRLLKIKAKHMPITRQYRKCVAQVLDKQQQMLVEIAIISPDIELITGDMNKLFYYPGDEPNTTEKPKKVALPKFTYMNAKGAKETFRADDEQCECCDKPTAFVYEGPIYTEQEVDEPIICPRCIQNGSAADYYAAIFQSDIENESTLSASTRKTLMQKTPGIVSWQEQPWKTCCHEPCIYQGSLTFKCKQCQQQYTMPDAD